MKQALKDKIVRIANAGVAMYRELQLGIEELEEDVKQAEAIGRAEVSAIRKDLDAEQLRRSDVEGELDAYRTLANKAIDLLQCEAIGYKKQISDLKLASTFIEKVEAAMKGMTYVAIRHQTGRFYAIGRKDVEIIFDGHFDSLRSAMGRFIR